MTVCVASTPVCRCSRPLRVSARAPPACGLNFVSTLVWFWKPVRDELEGIVSKDSLLYEFAIKTQVHAPRAGSTGTAVCRMNCLQSGAHRFENELSSIYTSVWGLLGESAFSIGTLTSRSLVSISELLRMENDKGMCSPVTGAVSSGWVITGRPPLT